MLLACMIAGCAVGVTSGLIALAMMSLFDIDPPAAFIIGCGSCLLASIILASRRTSDDNGA